jgi:hypothetical protein
MTDLEINESLEPGIYQHFKGGRYQVLHTAQHSETGEIMVVYRALYGERGLWVRPLTMFLETVDCNGRIVPRFNKIVSS